MTAVGAAISVTSMARTAWHFWWGVANIVQFLPPMLEEAHASHSQLEAEKEEAMMGGLWVLVVRVVVHAGCVCAASPCCFVRLTCIGAPKTLANHGILGIAGKLSMRQTNLLHLMKANL
jgi:hypothetical protein